MRATNSTSLAPLVLKLVGTILILSSLLDYIVLLFPFNPTNKGWQLSTAAQLVDRGIIPMVGLAFLLAGYWMSNVAGASSTDRPSAADGQPFLDLRLWAFLLSSILGLIFLLLVPLHLTNINTQKGLALAQINQGASQAESQLQSQLQQVDALTKNEQRLKELDQAINSGQAQGDQLTRLKAIREQLQQFRQNPQALNQRLEQLQTELRSRKLEAEKTATQQAWKLGIRTGLSSLLLALGYSAIGWTGLMSMLGSRSGGRRKPKMR